MDYSKYLNKTITDIKPSGIRKFFDIVAEQKDAISLGVGEPDFDTPWIGRNEAIKSLHNGLTSYTSNCGMIELRELISQYYNIRYNLLYDEKEEIIVTVGASEGIDLAIRSLITPGEEVLIPDPSYVSYAPCVKFAGGTPVSIHCTNEDGFIITNDELKKVITDKTKAIILPYPNNPTGGIMTESQLEDIRQTIIDNDLIVISDEIYSELTYGSKHVSIASLDGMKERTIVINGFSKAYSMTGFRLGYCLGPKEIIYSMYKIHQYTIMCAPTTSQYAAIAILKDEFKNNFSSLKEMKDEYFLRKKNVYNSLINMGFDVFEPNGAFYVFPSVKKFGLNGEKFAEKLLYEQKVAVVPGSAFGKSGENHIRISYAYNMDNLTKALDRIKKFVNSL
ncbi:MAG: aminotransferase class I/II-fold pyridoxal phosphate-dependent enzyme [Clostridia bacterium]|nr:aminotransferase class I/II-fold pyridoxal phosphate-dependent enzyme [Clostridia bacterium]